MKKGWEYRDVQDWIDEMRIEPFKSCGVVGE